MPLFIFQFLYILLKSFRQKVSYSILINAVSINILILEMLYLLFFILLTNLYILCNKGIFLLSKEPGLRSMVNWTSCMKDVYLIDKKKKGHCLEVSFRTASMAMSEIMDTNPLYSTCLNTSVRFMMQIWFWKYKDSVWSLNTINAIDKILHLSEKIEAY